MRADRRHQIVVSGDDDDRGDVRRPLEFALIRRLFTYTRPYTARRNILLCLVVLRSMQLPLVAWAIGAVINGPIADSNPPGIALGVLGFTLLTALTEFTFHFRQRLALQLGEDVVRDLRNDMFAHLQRMPIAYFDKTKLGRIISRMVSDVEAVRAGVQDVFFVSMVALGQMIASSVIMLWYDWVLWLIVMGMAPVMYFVNVLLRGRLSDIKRVTQESFSRITATMAESVSGIRVTQGFVRQDMNAGLFRQLVTDHSQYNLNMARTTGVLTQLLEFNSQFFIAVVLAVGGYRALHPDLQMPAGNLIQFFFLAGIFFHPVQILGRMYDTALTAMAGAERVFRLLDTQPEWEDAGDAVALSDMRGRVEFRNLTFGYNPSDPVLHDVNFVAEPGQTVALVGHTGSGKSTIISLIAKFYLPGKGELTIDDHEIRGIAGQSLHRHMGIILQQNFLFTGTVMDNIRFGRPGASDEDVTAAAEKLGCRDLIETLPDGFQTHVGERGTGLSLGQRQLICFTRAMLADPQIFVLDEATSSVDSMTEARIQRSLETLLKGRTSFVIAHRLSTIRNADLVLVLDRGRIVERGSHTDLLSRGEVYANLYRQFIASHHHDRNVRPEFGDQ